MDEVLAEMLLPPKPNGFAEGLPLFDEVSRTPADVVVDDAPPPAR
jgi:hypothetical protein